MGTKPVLRGKTFVEALCKKFAPHERSAHGVQTALAAQFGCSSLAIYNWQTKNQRVTGSQIAHLFEKAQKHAQRRAIQPVVEFFDFAATKEKVNKSSAVVRKYKNYALFRSDNKYENGLAEELDAKKGIYIFYDSRGRALYVGKAVEQSLWQEINSALNRSRDVQRVRRVQHPQRSVVFRTSEEKSRQIGPIKMRLHELASFVSAYEVAPSVIGVFEAVLVRSFANDLLNVKMEKFAGKSRKKRVRRRR